MSKKLLSVILAVSMVLTMCVGAFSVSAAEGAVTISGGDADNLVTGDAGDEITIPVNISGNTEGITSYKISLVYDEDYITPVLDPNYDPDTAADHPDMTNYGLVEGDVVFPVVISNPLDEVAESQEKCVTVQGMNMFGNVTSNGMLFGYKFKINDSIDTRASSEVRIEVQELKYFSSSSAESPDREIAAIKNATVTINPDLPLQDQNVTVPDLSVKTYGDAPFSWACTPDVASGITEAKYSSSNPEVATIDADSGLVTIVGKGETDLTVKLEGNDQYATFTATKKLTVNPIAITVRAENASKLVNNPDPERFEYTVEGTVLEADEVTGTLVREAGEEVKTYAINESETDTFRVVKKADKTLNPNYTVTFVPGVFTIMDKTPQTITVAEPNVKKTYGDDPFKITVTPDAESKLEDFHFSVPEDQTVVELDEDTGDVTIVGAGSVVITVTEPGNDDYAPAEAQVQLTVDPAPLVISLTGKTITYGESIGEFEITYTGFVNNETKENLDTDVQIKGIPEGDKINAGTYALTLEGASDSNYSISYTDADLVVERRAVEVASIGVYDKTVDGTTVAEVNPTKITLTEDKGFLTGDDAYVSITDYTAEFADAEAGADKTVTFSSVTAEVIGKDKDNYTISVAEGAKTTTATIFAEGAMTVQDVANQIGDYISVKADDKELELPKVPDGFVVTVTNTDNPEVVEITDSGAVLIKHTDKEERVEVTFTVATQDGSETADKIVTVIVAKGANKTVNTAIFGYGRLEGNTGEQPIGSEITLTAYPNDGYRVSEWFVNGESIGGADRNTYTFTLEDDITIGVSFVQKASGGIPSTGTGTSTSTVKAPTASVTSGSTVFKGSIVELSTTTSGAKIYYTVDGSTPTTTNATLYTADGIRISGDVEIKAFAMKDSNTSQVVTFKYKMKTATAEFKENANEIKYMDSVSDQLFEPDRAATRYEVLGALDELMDIEDANIENGFSDVTAAYEALVNKFAATSIVDGYPNKTFGGESSITRAEFVKMLAAALNLDMSGTATHNFKDVQSGHWAENYIAAFSKLGYIIGDPDGNFRPDDNVTRAEVVTVINRILEVESTPDAEQKYTDVEKDHWAYGYIMAAAKDKE